MFNSDLFNDLLWNDSGEGAFVPVVVDTPDPGVSFTISDERGGISEVDGSDGCEC